MRRLRITRIDDTVVLPTGFEWDESKHDSNYAKHGIPFDAAPSVFLDPDRLEETDRRREYGEARANVVGQVDGVCLTVTFTMRGTVARIISARRSSREERKRYGDRSQVDG